MSRAPAERPLDAAEEAVLRALQPAILELMRRWDADLVKDQKISVTEYNVLRILSEAESGRLRMSELAAECHQSLSAVSRTVGRLERDDLVRRERSSADARGADAVLTRAGRRRLERAWPAHLRSVRRSLFDHLSGLDLEALARSLRSIADGADRSTDEPHTG